MIILQKICLRYLSSNELSVRNESRSVTPVQNIILFYKSISEKVRICSKFQTTFFLAIFSVNECAFSFA